MTEDKKCPVDRGKLMIGLECCRSRSGGKCLECPYLKQDCDVTLLEDAMAYIGFLEAKLGVS